MSFGATGHPTLFRIGMRLVPPQRRHVFGIIGEYSLREKIISVVGNYAKSPGTSLPWTSVRR